VSGSLTAIDSTRPLDPAEAMEDLERVRALLEDIYRRALRAEDWELASDVAVALSRNARALDVLRMMP